MELTQISGTFYPKAIEIIFFPGTHGEFSKRDQTLTTKLKKTLDD
jgi:hypothetical protein